MDAFTNFLTLVKADLFWQADHKGRMTPAKRRARLQRFNGLRGWYERGYIPCGEGRTVNL